MDAARATAWRLLHPRERGAHREAGALIPLRRVYVETRDGWRFPLRVAPAAPGGAGEPVLLAHALGLGGDAYRYGAGAHLTRALQNAGFSVYLADHRGDREAEAPNAAAQVAFDDIVRFDVPASLDKIRESSGFDSVFWVGHGMGGQIGLAGAARHADRFAGVVALCAPVRFAMPLRSEAVRLARLGRLMPAGWRVPCRAPAWLTAPLVGSGFEGLVQPGGATPGARLRGVLEAGVQDVPAGLLGQVDRWFSTGVWSDAGGGLDYLETLREARADLLCVVASDDDICSPPDGAAAAARWGGASSVHLLPPGWGHLDVVLGDGAEQLVFQPVVAWLAARRRAAWRRLTSL